MGRRRARRGPLPLGGLLLTMLVAGGVVSGCAETSSSSRGTSPKTTPAAHRCDDAPGTLTDLSDEPPAWRENASGRTWTTAKGCTVRIDVVADYDGPQHCGYQSARHIVVGHPVGARFQAGMVYVRDPGNVYRNAGIAAKLDPDASLPSGAEDTGLRLGGTEIWAIASDPSWLYLRDGERVERWPLDRRPTLCL